MDNELRILIKTVIRKAKEECICDDEIESLLNTLTFSGIYDVQSNVDSHGSYKEIIIDGEKFYPRNKVSGDVIDFIISVAQDSPEPDTMADIMRTLSTYGHTSSYIADYNHGDCIKAIRTFIIDDTPYEVSDHNPSDYTYSTQVSYDRSNDVLSYKEEVRW